MPAQHSLQVRVPRPPAFITYYAQRLLGVSPSLRPLLPLLTITYDELMHTLQVLADVASWTRVDMEESMDAPLPLEDTFYPLDRPITQTRQSEQSP